MRLTHIDNEASWPVVLLTLIRISSELLKQESKQSGKRAMCNVEILCNIVSAGVIPRPLWGESVRNASDRMDCRKETGEFHT